MKEEVSQKRKDALSAEEQWLKDQQEVRKQWLEKAQKQQEEVTVDNEEQQYDTVDDASTIANNDDETSISNIKAALTDATGSEDGADKKLVLLCYSGKKYAEAGHRLLNEIGVDNSRVFILEGGYKAWTAAGEEYENLIVTQ